MKAWKKCLLWAGIIFIIVGAISLVYYSKTYITRKEAREIVLKDMNVDEKNVHFDSVDFEIMENKYEIEFYYDKVEYEYVLNAKTGEILHKSIDRENYDFNH